MLLRLRGAQQRAGLHVELLDLDMRRQCVALHRLHVGQARKVLAEMTRGERPQEAGFQPGFGLRRIQRQRGVQEPGTRRILFQPGIQRVDQAVRFADAQRRAHAQGLRCLPQDEVDGFVEGIQMDGHGEELRRKSVRGVQTGARPGT